MGISILTDNKGVKVFRSDRFKYPQYSIRISKEVDGNWASSYQDVIFRKGVEIENGDVIIIHDAFPTLSVWRDKNDKLLRSKIVWMIMDFSYATEQPDKKSVQRTIDEMPDSFEAAEDEIPF